MHQRGVDRGELLLHEEEKLVLPPHGELTEAAPLPVGLLALRMPAG